MRVLITGGAGFIGSHVVETLLTSGHEPVVVDDLSSGLRDNLPASVPLHVIDICDAEGMARVFALVRPDAVCHQAAQLSVSRSVREPAFDARINVVGLLNALDNSLRTGVKRFVFASSGGVLYGDVFEPAAESSHCDPQSPYGISKWAGERYLRYFAAQGNMQTVALRYSNVYGPRQNPHGEAGVVAIFCKKMLRGEQAMINGAGECVRDYVYVTDVAEANRLALELPLPTPFVACNIGTGVPTDVNQLAGELYTSCQAARHSAGQEGVIPAPGHGPARAGDLMSNLVDGRLAHELLGWKPRIQLTEGLGDTVNWFLKMESL